jgi:hypothetical protein
MKSPREERYYRFQLFGIKSTNAFESQSLLQLKMSIVIKAVFGMRHRNGIVKE